MIRIIPDCIYKGKTKNVYKGPIVDEMETCFIEYTDNATGTVGADGIQMFDPGQNAVVGTIQSKSVVNRKMSHILFDLLEHHGLRTHRVPPECLPETVQLDQQKTEQYGDPVLTRAAPHIGDPSWVLVYKCTPIGKGLEWVVRNRLTGSFIRRFGEWGGIPDMTPCEPLLEITIKNDAQGDPIITRDILVRFGYMTVSEANEAACMVFKATSLITNKLAGYGMDLIDIKFELGRNSDNELVFIDEISLDIMRVLKDGKKITHEMMGAYLSNIEA